jgi:hypothetical protein
LPLIPYYFVDKGRSLSRFTKRPGQIQQFHGP